MHIIFIIFGYLSILFALITQIPQVITIIKHKSGKNISYPYLCLIMIDCILYILYGIGFILDENYDGIPIIIVGVIPFLISLLLLILKIYFKCTKKKIENKVEEVEQVEDKVEESDTNI